MSDDLYRTRLRFAAGRGLAMLHGKRAALTDNPVLLGQRVFEIDYVPEIRCCLIRRVPSARTDDMTSEEIAAADALLREMVGA